MRHHIKFILLFMTFLGKLDAQNYQALHGSDYAGSLGLGFNPSSILSSPLKWDLTMLGFQTKNYSNFYSLNKNITSDSSIQFKLNNGASKKNVYNSTNLNLLNFRTKFKEKYAIAFGVNLRSIIRAKTNYFDYQDSVKTSDDFLNINVNNQPLGLELYSSLWLETFAGIAKILEQSRYSKVYAGINLKSTKGLSAINLSAQNGRFQQIVTRDYPSYYFTSADLEYGYSSTLGKISSANTTRQNIKNFMSNAQSSVAVDVGVTWEKKKSAKYLLYEDDPNDGYSFKIGLSLMDLGFARYSYGLESMKTSGINLNAKGSSLEKKFDNTVQSLDVLNDTLATMVAQVSHLYGLYRIQNPTRLILNIDKRISKHIYINAELIQGLYGILPGANYSTTEIGVASITPRFENRFFGFYLPYTINKYNQQWMGAAIKFGPLVAGLHNIKVFKSNTDMQNGGGYFALVLSPYKIVKKVKSTTLDCPK